jgi:short-subunit dehydrogenase
MMRVIVTGASSGIGAALARHYAGQGAVLGLVARRKTELERLRSELPGAISLYPADVRDSHALQAAARDFIARYGCPDIVIANAGISIGTAADSSDDLAVFQEIVDVNVLGMAKTFQPFLSAMRAAGRGTLVGIASVAGYRGLPGSGAYSASKAAAISYLESLRVELHASGIKVVTVCPGYVATPMTARNPYPMPFILSADAAAEKIALIVARGRVHAVIPWPMAPIAGLLRVLPRWLYDRLFARAPRKPRRGGLR